MKRLFTCIFLLLSVLISIAPVSAAHPVQQTPHTLDFFVPVTGTLNDATPAEFWTFSGRADEAISLIVTTLSGDLDPTLRLVGPDGVIVAENDDLDSLVRDAGVEAVILPADGDYIVQVARYQDAAGLGTSTGQYQLVLTPGFARLALQASFDEGDLSWVTAFDDPVPLAQGRLQLRAAAPNATLTGFPQEARSFGDLYVQASARLSGSAPYAEIGLVVRASGINQDRNYQFKVNTRSQWSVLAQDELGTYAVRSWSPHTALNTANGVWTLAVLARGTDFAFYANGVLLGTVSDSRLNTPGTVGVLVGTAADQAVLPTILFDDLIVTTRLGTTYRGLPLALSTWDSPDPGVIADELRQSGQVALAPERDLFLIEKTLMSPGQDALFELIGSEQAIYDNFVLSATINTVTQGQSVGCGVVYRWQDDENLSLAFVDTAGGWGLVQSRNGQLIRNVYDLSPMVQDQNNKLLIIAQGDRVALYVNGALVAQEDDLRSAGRVGVGLLNYEAVRTDCFWSSVWVWPLEGG
jgi:hypothetical protein